MPKFHARNITVQLSVADLTKTTANPNSISNVSNAADIAAIAAEFVGESKYGTLTEAPLNVEGSDTRLRFLDAHSTSPFFMVHAGKHFFDPSTNVRHSMEPERFKEPEPIESNPSSSSTRHLHEPAAGDQLVDCDADYHLRNLPPSVKPYALCLTVYLSESSFLPYLHPVTKSLLYHDIKIDVYFNGELTNTSLIPGRYQAGVYLFNEQIARLTGRKIGRLVEKPWVLVPSGQTPDGNNREFTGSSGLYRGAKQRWEDLAQSLEAEAEKAGRDELGNLSMLGKYLSSLAKLEMPPEVETMQTAGGPKFGVIDVVITSVQGHKDDSSHPFLLEPTRMRLKTVRKDTHNNSHVNNPETIEDVSTEPTSNRLGRTNTDHLSLLKYHAYDEILNQGKDVFDRTPRLRAFLSSPSATSNSRSIYEARGAGTSATNTFGLLLQSSSPNTYRTDPRARTQRSIPPSVGEDGGDGDDNNDIQFPVDYLQDRSTPDRRRRIGEDPTESHSGKRRRTGDTQVATDSLNGQSFTSMAPRTGSLVSQRPSGPLDLEQGKHEDAAQKIHKGASPSRQAKRRSRGTYEMVYDNRMTATEEFESIETDAQKEQLEANQRGPRNQALSRGIRRSTRNSGNRGGETPRNQTPVPIARFPDNNRPIIPFNPVNPKPDHSSTSFPLSSALSAPQPIMPTPELSSPLGSRRLLTQPTPFTQSVPLIPSRLLPTAPSAFRPSAARTLRADTWPTPALSQDAVVTYAAEGVLRPVKAERGGWVQEEEVIMGVRFLIG